MPRSEPDGQVLARFRARMQIPIVLAALLPLIIVPESGGWVAELVGVIAWVVFVVDFVVSERRLTHYLGTWLGRFDLSVVVLTAPWYLLPGMHEGRFVVILWLARLARVVMASRGARRLMERLGRVGLVALGVLVISTAVADHAEHATNPGFATYGDSLWWGIVTMTTVGYGDIVPHTQTGRWAAVAIMLTGVAVLGVLAGSLASFFRLEPADQEQKPTADAASPSDDTSAAVTPTPEIIFRKMDELRAEMELLMALLPTQTQDQAGDSS
jgi:voltage-gated potassium channel